MTEYNDPKDRVEANNWFGPSGALAELDALKFAFSAIVDLVAKPGTNERETGQNACVGVRHRINYLHDSLRRLLSK